MIHELGFTGLWALIMQVLLCIWVYNIVDVGVLGTAFEISNYGPPELGQIMIITFSWWARNDALG